MLQEPPSWGLCKPQRGCTAREVSSCPAQAEPSPGLLLRSLLSHGSRLALGWHLTRTGGLVSGCRQAAAQHGVTLKVPWDTVSPQGRVPCDPQSLGGSRGKPSHSRPACQLPPPLPPHSLGSQPQAGPGARPLSPLFPLSGLGSTSPRGSRHPLHLGHVRTPGRPHHPRGQALTLPGGLPQAWPPQRGSADGSSCLRPGSSRSREPGPAIGLSPSSGSWPKPSLRSPAGPRQRLTPPILTAPTALGGCEHPQASSPSETPSWAKVSANGCLPEDLGLAQALC